MLYSYLKNSTFSKLLTGATFHRVGYQAIYFCCSVTSNSNLSLFNILQAMHDFHWIYGYLENIEHWKKAYMFSILIHKLKI